MQDLIYYLFHVHKAIKNKIWSHFKSLSHNWLCPVWRLNSMNLRKYVPVCHCALIQKKSALGRLRIFFFIFIFWRKILGDPTHTYSYTWSTRLIVQSCNAECSAAQILMLRTIRAMCSGAGFEAGCKNLQVL